MRGLRRQSPFPCSRRLARLALALGACGLFGAPVAAQSAAPQGSSLGAKPGADLAAAAFDCLMDAEMKVQLAAPIAGSLHDVEVRRGDRVNKGQLVAKLVSDVEEANLAMAEVKARSDVGVKAARARLELARRKIERIGPLRAAKIVTEKDYDEAVADQRVAVENEREALFNQETAQAELQRAQAQVAQRRVYSPLDGVVVERFLSPGEYVHDQAKILSLAAIDTLHVEVFIPAAYYGQIEPGAIGRVTPAEPLGGDYAAKVVVVDPVIDATSGTFGVRLDLPNPDRKLPAGLRCRIRFAK
jgi:RND family efflux transporter MFP subunit